MGILPKVINYKFGSLPLLEILAEAQTATRSCIANQRVEKLNLKAEQNTIRVGKFKAIGSTNRLIPFQPNERWNDE